MFLFPLEVIIAYKEVAHLSLLWWDKWERAPGVSLYNAYFYSSFNRACFPQTPSTLTTLLEAWRLEWDSVEVFQMGPSVEPVVSHIHRGTVTKSRRPFTKNQIYFYPEHLFSSIGRIWHEYLQENWVNSMILCTATLKQNCPARQDSSSALSNYQREILKEKCLTFRIKNPILQLWINSKSTVPLHSLSCSVLGAVHLSPQEKEKVIKAH